MTEKFNFGSLKETKKSTAPAKLSTQKAIEKIILETTLTKEEVMERVETKKQELKGLISEEGALFIIAKELGIDLSKKASSKKDLEDAFGGNTHIESKPLLKEKKKVIEVKENNLIEKEYPMEIVETNTTTTSLMNLPTKEEVKEYLEMYNYVKKKIVDPSDFIRISGREFMKKSGWRKFVKAFNLSIKLMETRTFELDGDIHAEAKVRAILPSGQFVEGYAIKSKSEYWSKQHNNYGNYNLHNLIATAVTRATNRAISDLVGFGEVSAEEVISSPDKKTEGILDDAFG